MSIRTAPPVRSDAAGDGAFEASRGSRTHKGIDYQVAPATGVYSPVPGVVTKIGFPYGSGYGGADSSTPYRYVEVTAGNLRHRVFYILPMVALGDFVTESEIIGLAQDVTRRYPSQGMELHVHYEILDPDDTPIDPSSYERGDIA